MVSAVLHSGVDRTSPIVYTRTFEDAPDMPPQNFTVVNSSSSSLSLRWEPPPSQFTNGFLRHFVINYRAIHCSDNGTDYGTGWNITSVGGSHTSINITNLLFWTCYHVRIAAFTVRESPFTTTKKIRTSEHAPTTAPWNFTVVNSSSTTLMLAWKLPPFRYAHGLIRNYVINYRAIHCSDNETDNGTRWSIKTVEGVHTSTNITNLLFWTWYDVRVAAFTVRESPFTTTKKIRTSEHAPTASPKNFHVISNRSYNLQLTWMPPPNSDSHGIIRYYLVKYRAVRCSTGTTIQARWSVTTAKATLKSKSIRICPYPTCYDVWISAVTVGGSPYAKNTNVKMAGHGPNIIPWPCDNNATCQLEPNGMYSCSCIPGYTGRNCSFNIDECKTNPCSKHGTCIDEVNSYRCICNGTYTGKNCEANIDPCSTANCTNGICVSHNTTYSCNCYGGYTGKNCIHNINECQSNPCMGNGICIDGVDSYRCICNEAFTGKSCMTMIDPCRTANCTNGICIRLGGAYRCNCYGGYTGINCDSFIDQCSLQSSDVCNEGQCFSENGTIFCNCSNGYSGRRCEFNQWPCRSNPCSNGGKCTNIKAGSRFAFSCKCHVDFEGDLCQLRKPYSCEQKPCKNDAACVERGGQGVFECICKVGYGGKTCQYFYGETAVSVTLKLKRSKGFNETAFRLAIAKRLNDFCITTPANCPTTNSKWNSRGRYRRGSSTSYVFKSSDIKILPGYPKTNQDGTVIVRFFVIVSKGYRKEGNSTASPSVSNTLDPNMVKESLKGKPDLSSFGFEIQSVKVLKTIREPTKNKFKTSKVLVIVIAALSLVFVTGLLVFAYMLFVRSKGMSIEVAKQRNCTQGRQHGASIGEANHTYENSEEEVKKTGPMPVSHTKVLEMEMKSLE